MRVYVQGMLDLYAATLDPEWLEEAVRVQVIVESSLSIFL